MLNRILYQIVTLPRLVKVGCLGITFLLFACTFGTIASIPAARARVAEQTTQTAIAQGEQAKQVAAAQQEQATQVTIDTAATSSAEAAAVVQANSNATATSVAAAQQTTAVAVAAATATAQTALDATTAAIAVATANTQATSIAQAQATAELQQTTEALAVAQTATAESKGLIPGLMAADIKVNLQNRDFTCTTAEKGELYYSWACTNETVYYYLRVDYYGRTLGTIDYINVSALQFTSEPMDELVAPFLGFMATMPYDGAEPDAARTWVEQTLPTLKGKGDVREKTFGGVSYRFFGIPTARTLQIGNLP